MTRPKHPKPDANQRQMIDALEALGFIVDDVSALAHLGYDLLVTGVDRRDNVVKTLKVEVKAEGGELTEREKEVYKAHWMRWGFDAPYVVARCVEDALDWFGA